MKTLRSDLVQTARDRAKAAIRFRLHYSRAEAVCCRRARQRIRTVTPRRSA